MLNKEVVVVGYSGHGVVVANAALMSGIDLRYYTELKPSKANPFNLKYLGSEEEEYFYVHKNKYNYILGVGNNKLRSQIVALLTSRNDRILNVVHPDTFIADTVKIGVGNFIAQNVSIPPLVIIGNYNILNTGSIIEHECHIGDFVHVGPGAVLTGNVVVEDLSFIGANAVIRQGVTIGRNVIIGAGTVVLEDVPENTTFVGNPGKII